MDVSRDGLSAEPTESFAETTVVRMIRICSFLTIKL